MGDQIRHVRLKAFAKINLALEVLHKRADGYHELRTIFQTISLADVLDIEFARARRTSIELESEIDIPDNLVLRAARVVLDELRLSASIRFRLMKNIPMGGGLGGGSTDAAAVLLALPHLVGRVIALPRLVELGTELGSDVPFFLIGGCALGLGRGTELYPLPDPVAGPGLLVAPGVHVSTADAYRSLGRDASYVPKGGSAVQAMALALAKDPAGWGACCRNDFEAAVFKAHPALEKIRRQLMRRGAAVARMSGSGSALFGFFEDAQQRDGAVTSLKGKSGTAVHATPIRFVSRRHYQALWAKQLAGNQ
jgi:4-diphosphocytidyl-2-C-methyl-D-erythritol kinase